MKKTIRKIELREWKTYRDLRLRSLADAPDAFGSTLALEQTRTDGQWASRLSSCEGSGQNLPLLAEVNGEPAGLAWGRIEDDDPDTAFLYQMWVAPSHRQRGIGKMLLDRVISWAKESDALILHLGVTDRDSPAMRLYLRAGFEPSEEPRPLRAGSDLLGLPMELTLRSKS